MPKSKREKKVSLTKTKSKGYAGKEKVIEEVRACVEKYSSVYVYMAENLRNAPLKGIRAEWADSRFFFGRSKQMAVALGKTASSEMRDGLAQVANTLVGQEGGLLFTNRARKDVERYFAQYSHDEYARAGFIATQTVTLPVGPLDRFAHSVEPYLRKLGMPTKLDCGVVTLLKEYTVCAEGDKLTSDQAKLLQLLNLKMATFKVILRAAWADGAFHVLDASVNAQ